ncbi:MAG TPA: phosphotransferase [Chloroflexia bacterium]|nr:phosphotransferase [Chloroflexia bacterium]
MRIKKEPSNITALDPEVATAFGVSPQITLLPGGYDLKTFRSREVVLRYLGEEAQAAGEWHAQLFSAIKENGFRVARPIRARNGAWMVKGWVAEHFLEGRHARLEDLPEVIKAVSHFHEALAGIPLPEYRKREKTIWDRADEWAWGVIAREIDPELYALAGELAGLRKPVELPSQLIHGDLNLSNILVADPLPPAIIDLAPYWRPPEFALAVTAYWVGPYRGDIAVLSQFKHLKAFDQMLIRAGLRMLLTQKDPWHANGLEDYRKANEIIIQFVTSLG